MKNVLFAIVMAVLCCGSVAAKDSKGMAQIKANVNRIATEKVGKSAPLIGVTATGSKSSSVSRSYVNAIIRAGGVPVTIIADTTVAYLNSVVQKLDGVLLTGGEDVAPSYYNQQPVEELGKVDTIRDVTELTVIRLAANRNIPMLGICRGCQELNIAFGGDLYQDLPTQKPSEIVHRLSGGGIRARHMVDIEENSKLYEIVGKRTLEVNSSHHQAVMKPAKGARIGAYAPDSVVESIDFYPNYRALGVQWHPEAFNGTSADMNKILNFFVSEARLFKRAKEIHEGVLSVDTHTDTPLDFEDGAELGVRGKSRVSVPMMVEGKLDSQFLAAYVGSDEKVKENGKTKRVVRPLNQETYDYCNARVLELIKATRQQIEKYGDVCGLAVSPADVARLKAEGKKAFFIGVENGIGIGLDLSRVKEYKDLGVRYITLSHTYDNQICNSSTHTADGAKGLTKFGKKLVKEMNRLGIIIDLSHASDGTFWDVMRLSKKPAVCTHSGARALCDNDRNLTDAQLKSLAEHGGVIQTVAYGDFLKKGGKATIDDYVHHIDYMVKVAGIDHVGIGTDFDGGGGVPGFQNDSDMINVTMKLLEMGYGEAELAKLWGGNFFRVMQENE